MSASPVQTVCPNGSRATSHVMPKNTLLATAEAMSQRWYVRCGSVKTGKARCEHMFSALPLRADIAQCSRHVRFVPIGDISTLQTAARWARLLCVATELV